ncbi:MAG: hypothetical protein EXS55_04115 [Candidatus Magasanikbacteria bacterium]|nr:hypothetical protein [Candidatus Magasanikbacteria bacterium]
MSTDKFLDPTQETDGAIEAKDDKLVRARNEILEVGNRFAKEGNASEMIKDIEQIDTGCVDLWTSFQESLRASKNIASKERAQKFLDFCVVYIQSLNARRQKPQESDVNKLSRLAFFAFLKNKISVVISYVQFYMEDSGELHEIYEAADSFLI